jgi:glutamine synthetase
MATSNIEIKASDSTSNPYISLAGMIAAGLDGIDNKIDPGEPTQIDPADYSDEERQRSGIRRVPTSLRQAIGEFNADPLFEALMPELMWRAYQEVKLAECDAFEANDEAFEFKVHFDVF